MGTLSKNAYHIAPQVKVLKGISIAYRVVVRNFVGGKEVTRRYGEENIPEKKDKVTRETDIDTVMLWLNDSI